MKFTTLEMTGIEVLRLGCQYNDGAWPIEHWRLHRERWRLYSVAIDEYITEKLAGKDYGSKVTGILLQLEIANFANWPLGPFRQGVKRVSFFRSNGQVYCTAQLSWPEIGKLILRKQFDAYVSAVLAAVDGLDGGKLIPKDFPAKQFRDDLAGALKMAKPSLLTKTSYRPRMEEVL
ncbi:hypothetical protein [Duganella sp. HH105]|uniref:hypothetical protein n=1 Tax=Duganella sp. HH105 TaxID=1781067 RepID=UPI00114D1778|nr:hypothetical protein [Duganella sp. HH105]